MKKFFESILDYIYKKKCYICGRSIECLKLCTECYGEMSYFQKSPTRIINGVDVFCAGLYENNLQKLIRGLKYHGQKDLAYYQAKFMKDYWSDVSDGSICQIVPVPLFHKRQKERRYNHMELVALELSKLTGYDVNFELVKRIKDTKPQYKLTKNQRMQNLESAFSVDNSKLKKGKILLIDDICTTGSTFENIIVELKKKGLNDIVCFATTTPLT